MTRRVKPPAAASVTLARGEHGSPSAARCSASFLHEGKRPIAQSGPNGSPRLGLRFARLDGKVQWMTARRLSLSVRSVARDERTRMRIPTILAVLALLLAGCNAHQGVNVSSQTGSEVFAGHYVDDNPYNPISYAQNNTGIGR